MLITPLLPVALYARVSTDRQLEAQSVESRAQALRERIAQDVPGILQRSDGLLEDILEFIDEGYSGSTLVRPGLERLRDLAAMGGVEWVYVHSPDRLARDVAPVWWTPVHSGREPRGGVPLPKHLPPSPPEFRAEAIRLARTGGKPHVWQTGGFVEAS